MSRDVHGSLDKRWAATFFLLFFVFLAELPWGRNFYPHVPTSYPYPWDPHGDPHGDPHTHGRPGSWRLRFCWLRAKIPLHGPIRTLSATRPDPTRPDPRTTSVHVDTERTSRQPDGGLVEDPSGPLVWSSRVRLMEYGHYLTEAYITRLDVGDTALIRIWVGRTNEARLHHNR